MRYIDEYRDGASVRALLQAIEAAATRPWVIMEICGGQTHAIVRYGLDRMLPDRVELVHGPGCPVCVTPLEMIDRAHAIARRSDVIMCSFGDMLRVPGSDGTLLSHRARGADVRVIYSPLDAVELAAAQPDRQVVLFAIGFETTAPANAMAIDLAARRGLTNFSVLMSHVLVPPAIEAILAADDNRVQGFLGPGHVCAVMGTREYELLARDHHTPIAISGFEPVDILDGILHVVRQLEAGEARVENLYARVVRPEGNPRARELVDRVFGICDRKWRGIGNIAASGYELRPAFTELDATRRFDVTNIQTIESPHCLQGAVLRGLVKPRDCPAFGRECTPATPLGATMVSDEGACAAYYSYGRHLSGRDGDLYALGGR
jgi:hydrogenase expression/formation protein HypD